MKNILVFLFFLIASHAIARPISVERRDTIFLKNGEIYKVKIVMIKNDTVFYKLYSSDQQKFFITAVVKSLNYNDGRVVIPSINPPSNESIIKLSPEAMFRKGKEDGKLFYKHKAIFWVGATTIVFSYLAPIIVGIISLRKPPLKNILLRDIRTKYSRINSYTPQQKQVFRDFFKDENYLAGYQIGARRRKAKAVWLGFLAALGIIFVAIAFFFILFLATFNYK